ncbi:MAG: MrcB family domain-containing protein [Methanobacterium sp.]
MNLDNEINKITSNKITKLYEISEEINKWTFVINKDFYFQLKESDEITWNSANDVKKDDIIFIYTGLPYSSIGFILKAVTDPFEDPIIRKEWNKLAVKIQKIVEIPEPITLKELVNNPILSQWAPVKKTHFKFQGSHFKMSNKEYNELLKLILDKNSHLNAEIESIESSEEEPEFPVESSDLDYYDLSAGRAHIVRDICYLLSQNKFISTDEFLDKLRENIGDNNDYWRAYYQRSTKNTSPGYNLNSARTLGLVDKHELKLTDKGQKLVNSVDKKELYTYNYSIDTKKFFFQLALENTSIKTAMQILKEKGKLRFYSPLCEKTNKIVWPMKINEDGVKCENDKEETCKSCDRDLLSHIKESSLPLETLIKTSDKGSGFSFWMCSRVTPMHLTGTKPVYSGNYINWDKEAEEELGDLIKFLNDEGQTALPMKIWKIAPGDYQKKQIMWPIFKDKGYIGVGWFGCKEFERRSFTGYKTYDGLHDALKKCSKKDTVGANTSMIWNFGNVMQIGDLVVANDGYKGILGIGVIKSDYISPNESFKLNLDPDKEYFHYREVNWFITDPIEMDDDYFFARQTITSITPKKWIEIKNTYIKKSSSYNEIFDEIEETSNAPIPDSFNCIKELFQEYKNSFLESDAGSLHNNIYDLERQKVLKYFDIIQNDEQAISQIVDPPINHLLPIKQPAIAPVAVGDIKAFGYKDEDLPNLTIAIRDLIIKLMETDDKEVQKSLISNFKKGDYKKGFQTAMLTPTLYYLKPEFWFINRKTVSTYNLLSEILGDNDKISGVLEEYIDNNEKLHKLVQKLSNFIPELDFETFDAFCHWMCEDSLGNYACNRQKFEEWLKVKTTQTGPINIRNLLDDLLNNYKPAKDGNVSSLEQRRVNDILANQLPNLLTEKIGDEYQIYSSGWDKWHYSPYVALMHREITNSPNHGFFVNYIFREDMSGLYLSLRLGVGEIYRDENYKKDLNTKSEEYRQLLNALDIVHFNDEIDLKGKNGSYIPFYEAANIYSKFYPSDMLPSEEEVESDLNKMLDLYNSLNEIIMNKSFNEYLKEKNYLYTSETVENFLLSLKVKPFVILTGNSGTGKTKIAQLYAEYLQTKNKGSYQIIPVGANWTENRHLLGFYNVITQDYQNTRSLELLLECSDDCNNPYILILDEMNLSHVERYFADFLSAMESGKTIPLHSNNNSENPLTIPKELEIPNNILVVGTVNVDETTYMFSPKVLDRANTIEFATYPAKNYILREFEENNFNGDIKYLEDPLSNLNIREAKVKDLEDLLKDVQIPGNSDLWSILADEINNFQIALGKAGFDFGFRVIDEILRFMYVAWLYEKSPDNWNNWRRYFDAQIMQKMLPKIHGSQRELDITLENLFKLCYTDNIENSIWYSQELKEEFSIYPNSAKKLQWMGKTLQEKRFVSFTN